MISTNGNIIDRWKLPYQNRSFFYFVKIIYIQSIKLGSTKDLLGWNLYHYSNVTRAESHSYRHIFKLFSCQSWTICHKAQNDSEDGWYEFRPEKILCGKNLICILRHQRVPVLRPIKNSEHRKYHLQSMKWYLCLPECRVISFKIIHQKSRRKFSGFESWMKCFDLC